jgi:hypothetical protein
LFEVGIAGQISDKLIENAEELGIETFCSPENHVENQSLGKLSVLFESARTLVQIESPPAELFDRLLNVHGE